MIPAARSKRQASSSPSPTLAASAAPAADHPFLGRSLAVIEDFNHQERLYLYQQARRLKDALQSDSASSVLDEFRIGDPDFGMYEVFLEDSTRTRESFKNAAHFHRLKFSEFNAPSSSFNKSESYADTFANLVGYGNRVFVIRSRLEGVCRHLSEQIDGYRRRHGLPWPVSFINAGDGRHEHPTQELLDEFTFLEDLDWSPKRIHLALVGDLYHGRTVHSKVRGLGLFEEVTVDLVAPPELSMPRHYVDSMRGQGFVVREFTSIEEYLEHGEKLEDTDAPGNAPSSGPDADNSDAAGENINLQSLGVAPQWYFTRPQLERMGERILRRQGELRAAITFDPADTHRLPEGTHFYHPLPRHREHPTIPTQLDDSPLNGWERQSANGWIVRIALLAMIGGRIGADYSGSVGAQPVNQRVHLPAGYQSGNDMRTGDREATAHYLERRHSTPVRDHTSTASRARSKQYSEGIRPIADGLVIDHICAGDTPAEIREHLATLIRVMELHGTGGEWVSTGSDGRHKGILFRPRHPAPSQKMIDKLAAVIPGATVNVIVAGAVTRKIRLHHPERIADLPELICSNESCITHPANGEHILPWFVACEGAYACAYCSTIHTFREIWR